VTVISTTVGDIAFRSVNATVYAATALREANFVEQPYLYCRSLAIKAAPDVDECVLEFEYGRIIRPDETAFATYTAKDLVGKFLKVVITDTSNLYLDVEWYGVVVHEDEIPSGSLNQTIPTGSQRFIAAGLLWLADRHPIRRARISMPSGLTSTKIFRGLPFNLDPGGAFIARGNRSENKIDGTYVFSSEPRTEHTWTAYQAVEHLLKWHSPARTEGGAAVNTWEFHPDADEDLLSWYDVTVPTDGNTLKACLDALIDRRRGVGYVAEFDPTTDKVLIRPFSFNESPVTLPSGAILPENPDQYELNYEEAIDVEAQTSRTGISQYHRVVARGARRTSTLTARLSDDGILIPAWSATEESEYLVAASNLDGYEYLPDDEKHALNAAYRASDRLRNVFRRFKLNEEWDGYAEDWHGEDVGEYCWSPGISDIDEPLDIVCDNGQLYVWRRGVTIMRSLPLLDRYDYSGDAIAYSTFNVGMDAKDQPEHIPPFAYTPIGNDIWHYLDKLSLTAPLEDGRNWSAGLNIIDTEPAIEITATPNQLIGITEWNQAEQYGTLGAAAPDHAPDSTGNGITWRNIYVTLCYELDEHVEQISEIAAPAANAPASILLINIPDARYDYVLPFTTVGIKDGAPSVTTTGGAVRDDRQRLADIVRAAAEWYGRNRQTLDLRYKQVRRLFTIGSLILRTGVYGSTEEINTVVTSITYDLGGAAAPGGSQIQTTHLMTSYAELDFT
jgi:hypothetical protein